MMKRTMLACSAALALGACGGDAATEAEESTGPVDAMLPGEYQIVTEVTQLDSTDNTTPRATAAMGESTTGTVCVGEDGLLPAEAFGELGDDCTIKQPYVRRGKIRQQLSCSRENSPGTIELNVEADFTEDGVEGTVSTESYFVADGDYSMRRSLTGRRVGDCTQGEAEEELEGDIEG